MSRIVIKTGQAPPRAMPLPHNGVVRIGSSAACDLTLAAPGIRSLHCALKCVDGKVGLIVMHAAAEVRVNGELVRKKVLEEGDLISLGESEIRLCIDDKDPLLGKSIAGYRIEERLGTGAMGTVYRAKQVSLDRTVALKILSARFANDPEFVRAFLKEARAVARLSHPKVVHVHDAGQEEGKFYFSMEYLPGGTLEDRLRRDGAVPLDEALRYARDAAEALAWAEERGIVHRDVKPGNLLLAADGTVKLGDLGVAVDLSSGAGQSRKAGSPAYMAPEQARAGPIDHRADVYGLGSTLFHLLSGKLPFTAAGTAEIVRSKLTEEAPSLASVVPDAPPEVSRLLQRMIARDPKRRFRTCREMLDAIESCLVTVAGGPTATRVSQGPLRESTDRGRKSRGMKRLAALAVAVIAIGSAILAWWPDRQGTGAPESGGDELASASAPPGRTSSGPARDTVSGAAAATDGGARAEDFRDAIEPAGRGASAGAGEDSRSPVDDHSPSTPPRVDPEVEREQLRVLKELGAIRRDWLAGVVASPKALQLIGEFQKRHPQPVYGEPIARVLREIGDKVAAASRSLLQREFDDVVGPRIDRVDYAGARAHLVELMTRFPEHRDLIEGELGKVDSASERLWASAAAKVDEELRCGDFDRGRRSLATLEKTLPPSFAERVRRKTADLEAAREAYWKAAAVLYEWELKVEDAIRRGAFDEAGAVSPGDVIDDSAIAKILAERWSRMGRDIERCAAAWSRLRAGIEQVAARKGVIQLRRAGRPDEEPVSARLRELRDTTLLFRPANGTRIESLELLALSDGNLLELTFETLRAADSSAQAEAIEALGALLLYAQGPARAAGVFVDSRLVETRRAEHAKRLEIEDGHFLGRRIHALTVEEERLRERDSKRLSSRDVTAWEELAREAGAAIREYRKRPAYGRARERLAALYVEARAHILSEAAPESLVHATRVTDKGGAIELSYRFQDESELLDFRRAGSGGSISLGEVGLRLNGEYRLLRGNPFRSRLIVDARLRADGYDGDAPNINVALWTHDGDQVTARREAVAASGEGGAPGDYAIFGIGYHVPSGTLPVAGAGDGKIDLPADVLMGGKRGMPLGTFPASECVWAARVSGRKTSQSFSIAMTPKTLLWKVNGRTRSLTARELDRFYREDDRTGSVTLFSNGSTVEYSALTITGELDPAWIEAEVRTRALDALRLLEPDHQRESGVPR